MRSRRTDLQNKKMSMRRSGRTLQSDRHVLDAARSSYDFAQGGLKPHDVAMVQEH